MLSLFEITQKREHQRTYGLHPSKQKSKARHCYKNTGNPELKIAKM